MSTSPTPPVNPHTLAKLLTLLGSGLITGSILSLSTYAVPALLLPSTQNHPLPPRTIQAQWSHIYHSGKRTIPFLALFTTTAYVYLWKVAASTVGAGAAAGWNSKGRLWLLSAGCTIAIVPYTVLFMRWNIDALERAGAALLEGTTASSSSSSSSASAATSTAAPAAEQPLASTSSSSEESVRPTQSPEEAEKLRVKAAQEETKNVRKLVDEWGVYNLGRAVLTGTGFVVGLWASLS